MPNSITSSCWKRRSFRFRKERMAASTKPGCPSPYFFEAMAVDSFCNTCINPFKAWPKRSIDALLNGSKTSREALIPRLISSTCCLLLSLEVSPGLPVAPVTSLLFSASFDMAVNISIYETYNSLTTFTFPALAIACYLSAMTPMISITENDR